MLLAMTSPRLNATTVGRNDMLLGNAEAPDNKTETIITRRATGMMYL